MSRTTRQALAKASSIGWADPRKRYPAAAVSRVMLEQARTSIAQTMHCRPTEVAFVPGSPDDTMALAMRAAATALTQSSQDSFPIRLVISNIEEVRVLRAAESLSATPPLGSLVDLIHVPVDYTGIVSESALSDSVAGSPSVVVLQAANGELGTRQPLAAVAKTLPTNSRLIVDARHLVGRCAVPVVGDFVVADPGWAPWRSS